MENDVRDNEVKNKSHQAGSNQPTHVGESASKFILRSNGISNQREDGEWRDGDDPVNECEEKLTQLSEDHDKRAVRQFKVFLEHDFTQSNTKADGEDDDGSEVLINKVEEDVLGDELQEDTLINGVTHGDIITSTGGDTDEGTRDVINDKLCAFIRPISRATDRAVVCFGKVSHVVVTSELYNCWVIWRKVACFEERLEAKDTDQSNDGSDQRGEGVKNNSLDTNTARPSDHHHVNNGDNNVHEDERENDGLESADEKISDKTKPLKGDSLVFRISRIPSAEPNPKSNST